MHKQVRKIEEAGKGKIDSSQVTTCQTRQIYGPQCGAKYQQETQSGRKSELNDTKSCVKLPALTPAQAKALLLIDEELLSMIDRNSAWTFRNVHFLMMTALALCHWRALHGSLIPYHQYLLQKLVMRMQEEPIRSQVPEARLRDWVVWVLRGGWSPGEVIAMTRDVLREYRVEMMCVFPYYHDWFALACNRYALFLGEEVDLVEYSIRHEHKKYGGDFDEADVYYELAHLDDALSEAYTSQNA